MALKDWKLFQKSKGNFIYKKKDGSKELVILKGLREYSVEVPGFILEPFYTIKVYRTQASALKFAKQYMRTH